MYHMVSSFLLPPRRKATGRHTRKKITPPAPTLFSCFSLRAFLYSHKYHTVRGPFLRKAYEKPILKFWEFKKLPSLVVDENLRRGNHTPAHPPTLLSTLLLVVHPSLHRTHRSCLILTAFMPYFGENVFFSQHLVKLTYRSSSIIVNPI